MHTIAAAVVLGISLTASNAWALALGRASVQSGLGEPLHAEIDLPAITSDESASLQVGVADGDAFRAAGMDYNPLLTDVRFTVERRADGRTVLRLTSNRPVSEPFLDMVLQARWNGGQLVRGYTMLFDPPNLRTPAAPAPLLPSGSAASRAPGSATAATEAPPSEFRRPSPQPPTTRPRSAERPAAPAPAPANEGASVKVQPGDTAGRIAQANKPAEVSLDQMLVAMLRANPNAFINDNVNRLKAGAVLDVPTQANAAGIDAKEAHRIIVGQNHDFQEFRRRMAGAAPVKAPAPQARAASGQVQAEVTEKASPAPADKLTLSKGATSAKGGAEDKIAQQRQQEASSSRTGELSRNLEELNKLQQAASASASAPAASAPAPAAATLATSATTTTAPTPPTAEAPAAPPPAPAPAVKPPPPPPAAPKPTPEPSFIDSLTGSLSSNPLALPAAGGVAVLLGGLLWWRRRSAAKSATAAAFDDSLVQAGAADASGGGQSVDTSEQAGPVSSMMYSPSQLDAAGDVDPIAEADVYLAYGRDQQAEEILREALRIHPDRLPLRAKLLEVLAQRADKTGFEREATELLAQTSGTGAEWDAARTMGQQLDPSNPLYQGGSEHAEAPAADMPLDLDLGALSPQTSHEPSKPEPDLMAEADTPVAETAAEMPPMEATPAAPAPEHTPAPAAEGDHHLDFDLDLVNDIAAQAPALEPTPAPAVSSPEGLDFDIELEHESHAAPAQAESASTLPADIQDLSLDLPTEPAPAVGPDLGDLSQIEVSEGVATDNPLETKLSLAREFEAIGDVEGARSLAEEVEAEAAGDLQARARAFLAQLA